MKRIIHHPNFIRIAQKLKKLLITSSTAYRRSTTTVNKASSRILMDLYFFSTWCLLAAKWFFMLYSQTVGDIEKGHITGTHPQVRVAQ